MFTGVFLGSADSGKTWTHGVSSSDNGVAVLPLLTSNRFAPGGQDGEVVLLSVTIRTSSNCSAAFKLIPVVDEVRYDGVLAPDCSVAFSCTGDGRTVMPMSQAQTMGIAQNIVGGQTASAKLGIRGTWFQFEIVGTSTIGQAVDGQIGTVFLEGVSMEYQVLRGTDQPTAPGTATTPWPKQKGYSGNTGW